MSEPKMLHLVFTSEAAAKAYQQHRSKLQTLATQGKHRFPERPEHFKRGSNAPPPALSEHYEQLDKVAGKNIWRMRVPPADLQFAGHIDPETGHRFDLNSAVDETALPTELKPTPIAVPIGEVEK